MATLLDADNAEGVLRSGLPRALAAANRVFEDLRRGRVDARELVISKRLTRELTQYRSLQAHVVAALLAAEKKGIKLTVGFVERFNPAVQEAIGRVAKGEIGDIILTHATRVSRSPGQIGDVGVIKGLGQVVDVAGPSLG